MQQQFAKPVYYWEKDVKPAALTHNAQHRSPAQQSQSKPACAPIRLYTDKPTCENASATNTTPVTRQQRISSLLDRLEAEVLGR